MPDKIEKLLDALGYEYSVSSKYNSYEVNLHFDDDRQQRVYIRKNTETVNGVAFREIWSTSFMLAGKISNALALRLLENNNYRAIGAWSYSAAEHMVYFSCKVTDTFSAAALDSILIAVASDADRLEQKVMGVDIM